MSKVKYVEQRRRSDGTPYWVYNPPGALKALIGNATFVTFDDRRDAEDHAKHVNALYEDAKARDAQKIYIDAGTVRGLVATYKKTNAWTALRPNSKTTYTMLFEKALDVRLGNANVSIGEMHHSNFKAMHAEALYHFLKESVSEHRANHTMKVLRRVWNVAEKKGFVRGNPFAQMGLRGLPDRIVLWEPEQVMTFIKTADEAGYWSIGTLALLCYDLCQRPGDMKHLKWSNFDGHTFDFVQEKTRERVTIPASPRLLDRLHGINGVPSETILKYEATGKPYARYDYYKLASRIRNLAGLPSHLQLRDLRRTGATEMAEAGVTEDELRSVTGHKSRGILNAYVRPTKKLAAHGMNKRFAI
jgi:integrase